MGRIQLESTHWMKSKRVSTPFHPLLGSEGLSTQTNTVLFTDMADYTASVRRSNREGIRRLIESHHRRVGDVLEAHGGKVVKNLGDSFLTIFSAATDAVKAGLVLLESLDDEDDFKVRVSLATGDIEEIDGDYFGDAVNLASRILSVTPVDEIWFALSTQLSMNTTEIAYEETGVFSFKGFYGEIKLFRAVPNNKVYLPEPILKAIRQFDLVRIKPDLTIPRLNHDSIVLLTDVESNGSELEDVLGQLPSMPPHQIWLSGYQLPPADRWAWSQRGSGWIIGRSEVINATVEEEMSRSALVSSSMTMFLDRPRNSAGGLVMAGLALPRTPLSEVVLGYFYNLHADGAWVNTNEGIILRVSVDPTEVQITALTTGIQHNARMMKVGQTDKLNAESVIEAPCGEFVFTPLEGGPYVGILVGGGQPPFPIEFDATVEIGREPSKGGFFLSDRKGQQNILWCTGARAKRARSSGFTLDRALAGRRQAQIIESSGDIVLRHLHQHCPTYVLENELLSPVVQSRKMDYDEFVVMGTTVLHIQEPNI